MKFLCDQCHAKYQIADDKIAGKTLRMKCRRCGHDLELRGVLESSDHHVAADRQRSTTGSSVMPSTGLSGEVRTAPESVRPRATTGSHDAPPRPRTASGGQDARARTSSDAHDAAGRVRTSSASHMPASGHGPAGEPPRERVATGAPRPPASRPQTGRFGTREPTGAVGREPTGGAWKGDALGAGFQRSLQEGRGDGERKSAPPSADDWYVAIQDVPVGPVSKDEIARRIKNGDVRGGSLCWREGFDDWRPLEDVAELASLLRREREPTGRVPPPVPPGGRPPTGSFATASRGSPQSGSLGIRPPTGRFAAATRPAASSSGDSASARARVETPPPIESGPRGKVVPIGGRLGGSAAPRIEPSIESPTMLDVMDDMDAKPVVREPSMSFAVQSRSEPPPSTAAYPPPAARGPAPEPHAPAGSVAFASIPPGSSLSVSAPSSSSILVPPQSVPVQVQVQSRGMPAGAWIAIVGAAAFGIALAIVVGVRLTAPSPATVVASAPPPTREAPRAEPERVEAPSPPPPAPPPTQEAAVEIPAEPETPPVAAEGTGTSGSSRRSSDGSGSGGSRGSSSASSPSSATPVVAAAAGSRTKSRALTEDQRAALAAATGGGDVAGATTGALRVQDRILGGGESRGGAAPLTDEAVAAAVARNKPSLRACYERSVRGVSQEAMTRFRVSFAISVGASGAVTRVSISGAPAALPGLSDCFERTIRRWRFPQSGGSSRTEFTAVFQPGS